MMSDELNSIVFGAEFNLVSGALSKWMLALY